VARPLRTVTPHQVLALQTALTRARFTVAFLRQGGASPRLCRAAAALVKRIDGAYRHAIRAHWFVGR
jgi:hypothetical protein